jgi:G3E family GTPase
VCVLAANAAAAAANAAQAAASAIAPVAKLGTAPAAQSSSSATLPLPFGQLVRSKGHLWLASRHGMRGDWSHAGRVLRVDCGGPWYAAMAQDDWPLAADDEWRKEVRAYAPPPPSLAAALAFGLSKKKRNVQVCGV